MNLYPPHAASTLDEGTRVGRAVLGLRRVIQIRSSRRRAVKLDVRASRDKGSKKERTVKNVREHVASALGPGSQKRAFLIQETPLPASWHRRDRRRWK